MAFFHASRGDRGERHVADEAAPQDDVGLEVSQPEQALDERFHGSPRVAQDQRRPPRVPLEERVAGEEIGLAVAGSGRRSRCSRRYGQGYG